MGSTHDVCKIAQSVDGDVTTFAWDWASGIPEMLSDGASVYLVGHETLGQWDGAAWAYHLSDALGSVRQVADGAGAVVSAREWTPYGVEVGTPQPGLGYTGEWWDASVGMVYLRARWYDGQTGRFISKDTFLGLRTQPFSLHSYAYVLVNPVNAVDPSGLYHSDVHYDLTKKWALEIANSYGLSYMGMTIASEIAEGNQNVDDSGELNAGRCLRCHFCPFMPTIAHVNRAIQAYPASPFLFGATLHQLQDFYAHWNEGYDDGSGLGHARDSIRAGAYPWNHLRSPGGKSVRTVYQLDDFFEGGHYHVEPDWEAWVQSPSVHPREEVVAEIRKRNPAIDINGLNDNDLIDLYLRRDWNSGDWPQREQERGCYGLDPDAYVESSWRDTIMRLNSRAEINRFMQRFVSDRCSVYFTRPDDDLVRAILTE